MEKYTINFELIMVPRLEFDEYNLIDNKNISIGEAGCYISHMFCLLDAINNNYNRIIILEDDIILHKQFHEMFDDITNLNNIDLLMLGSSDYQFRMMNINFVKDNMYVPDKKTTMLRSTHAILYSNLMIKRVYYNRLIQPTYFDDNLLQFFDYDNSYIYSPNLAIVEFSTSSLGHNDYFLVNDKSYYYNCHYNINFRNYNFIYLFLFNHIVYSIDIDLINIINNLEIEELYKLNILSKIECNFFDSEFIAFILNFDLFKII